MTDAARGEYTPPTPQEAERHGVLALGLIEAMEGGKRQAVADLLQQLYDDLSVDPWALALGAAGWTVRRGRCTHRHRT